MYMFILPEEGKPTMADSCPSSCMYSSWRKSKFCSYCSVV